MILKALFQSNAKIPENFKGLSVELELQRKNKEWTYEFATVTGDKTGRTSQLISKPLLSIQPMKGCTTGVVPHHWGLRPLLFTNSGVGSFTSHKNQNRGRADRRGLRFYVLIVEE